MRRIRRHLTYANVMATLAVFLVLSGGTAVALSGSNTVQSDDLGPGAQVKAADVAANAVGSAGVINESLTGADVKNQSGVDTCIAGSIRLGPLCAGAADHADTWFQALNRCAALDLRLPSLGDALAMEVKHGIPNGVSAVWTEERFDIGSTPNLKSYAYVVQSNGATVVRDISDTSTGTACVTTPTN